MKRFFSIVFVLLIIFQVAFGSVFFHLHGDEGIHSTLTGCVESVEVSGESISSAQTENSVEHRCCQANHHHDLKANAFQAEEEDKPALTQAAHTCSHLNCIKILQNLYDHVQVLELKELDTPKSLPESFTLFNDLRESKTSCHFALNMSACDSPPSLGNSSLAILYQHFRL